jgi:lipoprotein-anchoring transpeptidase ErfK/SrfK
MSNCNHVIRFAGAFLIVAGATLWTTAASAQVVTLASNLTAAPISLNAQLDRSVAQETDAATDIPGRLRRQVVDYFTPEAPGTVIVDTPNTYLYYVLGDGKAIRYGIGVGREGFTWSGVKAIERKSEWPDWLPPAEMLRRQPYLPRFMAGGPGNPLGARAMYLSGTEYRIHGTNAPSTIGKQVSSGCIRMLNEDVIDLYGRTRVGTKVVVLPMAQQHFARMQRAEVPLTPARLSTSAGRSYGIY